MAKKLSDISKLIHSSEISFFNYLNDILEEDIVDIITRVSQSSDIFIFSGIIRNYFLGIYEFRDLDLVLEREIDIKKYFYDFEIHSNTFGGYKISKGQSVIDLWYMENTWAFKNQPILNFELQNHIPYTAFFNFSSIVYSYKQRKFIYSKQFLRFLRDKKIDVVYKPNANYTLCIINTIYYSEKYKLGISDKLKEYILTLHKRGGHDYIKTQIKHFGKILYNEEEIFSKLDQFVL